MPTTRENGIAANALAQAATAHSALAEIQRAQDALRTAMHEADEVRAMRITGAHQVYSTAVNAALARYQGAMDALAYDDTDADDDDQE